MNDLVFLLCFISVGSICFSVLILWALYLLLGEGGSENEELNEERYEIVIDGGSK